MRRVILCGSAALQRLADEPILKRSDLEVIPCPDIARTFLEVKKAGVDLLIWEQTGDIEEALIFLGRLEQSLPSTTTKAVCLWKDHIPKGLPEFIKHSLLAPADSALLSQAIAQSIGSFARGARRFAFRAPVVLKGDEGAVLCTSVDISRTGILLLTRERLSLGGQYALGVLGREKVQPSAIHLRIVREASPNPEHPFRYYGATFEGAPNLYMLLLAEAFALDG